jgi:pimeloyl-ACP methyl ester carboxylesterase
MRAAVLAVLVLLIAGRNASAEERIDITTPRGVVQSVYFTAVPSPVASVVLFPGGNGVFIQVRGNFLLRVAGRFVDQGINVAIADSPADHPGGMGVPFRQSAQHTDDIGAIVGYLKKRSAVPVWLIGTSNGTISAANGGAQLGNAIAGVVLTSSVWEGGINGVSLEQITAPVLVVHNRDDGCRASPFSEAEPAMQRLRQARVKQLVVVSGGMLRSDPCQALSPHGYYGIEDQVVPTIIAWIKAH